MKYGGVQWKGTRMEKARRIQKRLARKQERQNIKKELTPLAG